MGGKKIKSSGCNITTLGGGRHAVLYVCCCLIICLSLMDFFQEELAAKVAEQQAAVMAAGLLDKKESEDSSAVIGPSMLEPEPFHAEVKAAVLFFFGTLRFIHALDMFAEAITFEYTLRLSVLFRLCKRAGENITDTLAWRHLFLVCLIDGWKCNGRQKESQGGEGEKVYPHCSGNQLGGRQSVGLGDRWVRTWIFVHLNTIKHSDVQDVSVKMLTLFSFYQMTSVYSVETLAMRSMTTSWPGPSADIRLSSKLRFSALYFVGLLHRIYARNRPKAMLRSFVFYFFSVRFELCFSFVHISAKGIVRY